jgi:delta14-sterol reductase
LVLLAAPTLVQVLWAACDLDQCHVTTFVTTRVLNASSTWSSVAESLLGDVVSWRAVRWLTIWFAIQSFLRAVLPGRRVRGYVQRDGQQLDYVLNGFACLVATLLLGAVVVYFSSIYNDDWFDFAALQPRTGDLRTIVSTFQLASFLLVVLLGVKAHRSALGERSGSLLTDFFFGWEINPRIGSAVRSDIKFFLETHALIMWIAWDALFVWQQWSRDGSVSAALAITAFVQTIYVVHHFRDESFVLGVLDFTSENMGWMLTWGNIMFVGFMFTLPTLYASQNPSSLPWPLNVCIVSAALLGLYVFSTANHQKHQFKTHPEQPIWGEAPRYMSTQRGTKLLLSGWWGVARKINYSGDILLALCHGLPSGFDAVVPHIYFIYLTALLLHRAERDEALCKAKYGADWARYSAKVPYKFVPGIY